MNLLSQTLSKRDNYKWWVLFAVAFGTFASVMTHGSVNVALPTIATHFGTDLPTVQWVVIAEALTVSALLLPMGRLSDLVGRKQVYISGLVIFVAAAALAGFSNSIMLLILSKVIQGAGAAMTQGTGMAMVTSVFPEDERGKGIGTQMSIVGTGGMAGPVIGGLLVSALGWRWVFFINIPLGIIAAVAALLIMDKSIFFQERRGTRYDWLGAALSTGALVTFLMLMTNGYRAGWTSPPIVAAALAFGGLLATFIWWELRAPAPMLDLRLFARRVFALGVLASFVSFLGTSSVRFLMPFYLQGVLGFKPGQIGLIMLPTAITMTIMGPLAGRWSDKYGFRRFNVAGLTLSATGLYIISRLSETSSVSLVIVAMVLQAAGNGLFNSPNSASIFSAAEASKHGVVSALLSLVRNSANVTSIAVATTIVTATMVSMGYAPDLGDVRTSEDSGVLSAFVSGLRLLYLIMGSVLLIGVAASFFKGSQQTEKPTEPAPEPEARTSAD
jgi:EmrB/QacA subfamily drug resistance transporter